MLRLSAAVYDMVTFRSVTSTSEDNNSNTQYNAVARILQLDD